MQKISEIMTRDVKVISPNESLQRAAQIMDELNVGSLPVCDGERLVGVITDRDITVRSTSAGEAPQDARVSDAMTGEVHYCMEDDSVEDIMDKMADIQIRRVPVVDQDKRLVGIVALGDVATKAPKDAEGTLEDISTPSEPDRS
jgi:CBS domain-containing protein